MTSPPILALTAMAVTLVCGPPGSGAHPMLVWNATASEAQGFYRIEAAVALRVGDLVLLQPDPASAALYAKRGYLPRGVQLLKPIAATAGMRVCEQDGHVSIDGKAVAAALPTDGRGRPMASWHGCRVLAASEVFVLNTTIPASLDGRYFGPSPVSSVLGRAVPLWTWSAR